MVDSQREEIERLSPDKLISGFSKTSLLFGLVLAVALHAVVLGATSIDYLHGLIDPEWAEQQKRLAEQARRREADRLRPRPVATRPTSGPTTRPAKATGPAKARQVPKKYTELPKKGETPERPKLDLPIDDTDF